MTFATARAYMKLGWVHRRFFETNKGQTAYNRALDLLEPLVKEYPQELRYRSALANHQQNWHRAATQAGAVLATVTAEDLLIDWRLDELVAFSRGDGQV